MFLYTSHTTKMGKLLYAEYSIYQHTAITGLLLTSLAVVAQELRRLDYVAAIVPAALYVAQLAISSYIRYRLLRPCSQIQPVDASMIARDTPHRVYATKIGGASSYGACRLHDLDEMYNVPRSYTACYLANQVTGYDFGSTPDLNSYERLIRTALMVAIGLACYAWTMVVVYIMSTDPIGMLMWMTLVSGSFVVLAYYVYRKPVYDSLARHEYPINHDCGETAPVDSHIEELRTIAQYHKEESSAPDPAAHVSYLTPEEMDALAMMEKLAELCPTEDDKHQQHIDRLSADISSGKEPDGIYESFGPSQLCRDGNRLTAIGPIDADHPESTLKVTEYNFDNFDTKVCEKELDLSNGSFRPSRMSVHVNNSRLEDRDDPFLEHNTYRSVEPETQTADEPQLDAEYEEWLKATDTTPGTGREDPDKYYPLFVSSAHIFGGVPYRRAPTAQPTTQSTSQSTTQPTAQPTTRSTSQSTTQPNIYNRDGSPVRIIAPTSLEEHISSRIRGPSLAERWGNNIDNDEFDLSADQQSAMLQQTTYSTATQSTTQPNTQPTTQRVRFRGKPSS